MFFSVVNCVQALLLLLSNPALGWVAWYGSTQQQHNEVVAAAGAAAAAANFAADATTQQYDASAVQQPHDNHTAAPPGGGVIDILSLLNLSSRTPGVAQVPGPIRNVPAFKLRPGFGLVQVPNPSAVTSALSSPAGFTLIFVYRQHRKSLGTLLSVHPPGRVTPWFQLASNLRTGQLVTHYRLTTDEKLHQNAWPLRPPTPQHAAAIYSPNAISAPDTQRKGGIGWTYVMLSLNTSTNMLRLQLDCQPPRDQPLAGTGGRGARGAAAALGNGGVPSPRLHVPDDALVYFRQEPGFKKKFLGSMQVAKVFPYATNQHSDWVCNGYQLVRQLQ